MCSEPDNDRKPNEVVCWTGQINQVRESTQAMLRKEPRSWMQRATPDTCREAREEQVGPDRKHGLYLHGTMVLIPHVLPVRSLLVTLQIQTAAIKTVAVQHITFAELPLYWLPTHMWKFSQHFFLCKEASCYFCTIFLLESRHSISIAYFFISGFCLVKFINQEDGCQSLHIFEVPQDRTKSRWKQESYMMFSQQVVTSLTIQQSTTNPNLIQSTN